MGPFGDLPEKFSRSVENGEANTALDISCEVGVDEVHQTSVDVVLLLARSTMLKYSWVIEDVMRTLTQISALILVSKSLKLSDFQRSRYSKNADNS